ncbi:MAG: ABC transporter ATP-binding protein [Planctomycetes bacterium]|nr:ABC transporter ATP-binding protein [Planctomycetota bacterium]
MPASSNNAPVIEVEGLRKTYKSGFFRSRRVDALRSVSLTVERGTIFGLLGPNGAGKTTLIKVLLGIIRKTSGRAMLLGYEAGDRHGRMKVGYLPEHHRIPRHLTADTALEYYGALSGMSLRDIRSRRPEMLRIVGLEKWGKTLVRQFSKGMQQRLGLAQAMLHDPDLLVLDEPTDGVDPEGRSEMRATLRNLKDTGKSVFINSHLLQEIELVCDRVAILVKGEVRREGPVQEITQRRDAGLALTLHGTETHIRGALSAWRVTTWTQIADGQFRAVVSVRDQSEVDRCVDGLRQARISLAEMVRQRDTLEEAFLEIVRKRDTDSPFL